MATPTVINNGRIIADESGIDRLIALAKEAGEHAYSPYSRFRVGAAVLDSSGEAYAGCNVENASYGLTICAERNAIFHMAAQGGRKIIVIVIYTPTEEPTAPCGACRQVIHEFGPEARVICVCDGKNRIDVRTSDLLPRAFGPEDIL